MGADCAQLDGFGGKWTKNVTLLDSPGSGKPEPNSNVSDMLLGQNWPNFHNPGLK